MPGHELHPVGQGTADATGDVVFIHGLDGHYFSTWMQDPDDPASLWPQWLKDERPDLNIWCLEYPAASTGWKGHGMPLARLVPALLDRFGQSDVGGRPLVLVGHSMGGIVAKQLLRTAHDDRDAALARNLAGIAFLATPHSGSDMAGFVMAVRQALGTFGWLMRVQSTLSGLGSDDPWLENLNDWYRNTAPGLGVATIVYREDLPTSGVMVVDPGSANPGLAGVKAISVARDHITICKAVDRNDQVYRGVRKFVDERLPRQQPSAAVAPAAPTVAAPPAAMLPPRPALFGREAEAAALLAAVLDDDRRPLVVLGQAGIGKSALTLDMLHSTEVAARYGARRLFVRLDTATAASTIWTLILQALGSLPEADPQAQALALLAATPTLLVLDNAETPVQADMAGSVAVFGALAGVTSLQMLVSMRGQLPPPGIDWRRAINELQALPTDAAAALFRSIATGISADDPQLPDMLGLLGGLPLAITLMAHQAQGETRVQGLIADYRARRLRLSAGAGKQFDLAASIELSLASPRLDATARRLFAMAGRLPAGIAGADAAALVDGGTAAARALRQIGLAFGAGDRTLLLAPIREYAGGLALPAADEAALIEYYLALATEEGERIGNDGGAAALARLAPEIANLEASVAQAAALVADHAEGQAPLAAKAIAAAWGLAGLMRASGLGLPTTFDTLATMAGQAGDSFGEANCISSLGSIALARSDYPAAQAAFERALPLYQQADNKLGEVNCISSLGDVALARSDHAVARAAFTRALTLYQASEDTLGEANCIYSLGNIALERSEHAAAKAAYEQALQLYQQIDNKLGEAECIFRLGMLALEQPEPDLAAAEAAFERALPFYQEIGNTLGEANCILTLGNTALKRPDLAAARSAYERALPIYRLVGSKVGEGNCAFGLGDVVLAEGDSEAARRQWQAALALYRRIPDPYSIGEALRRLARVSEGAARAALVAEARAAWLSIDRPDLVTELDGEFGGG